MDAVASRFEFQLDTLFGSLQTSQVYVEDSVLDASRSPSSRGIIERTHEDVDSHAPEPQHDYPGLDIHKGSGISPSAFRTFLDDGIPPKGTALVRWRGLIPLELALLQNVRLVDRALLVGDVVKRNAQSTMSGTVTNVGMTCALLHTSLQTLEYNPTQRLEPQHVLCNVPAEELKHAQSYMEGSVVVYNDWVGRVDYTEKETSLRLSNGSVVVVEDPTELNGASKNNDTQVGEVVRTKKGNLRRGRWVYGAFDANVAPLGQVVDTRPVVVGVSWLFQKPGSTYEQPSEELDTDILESGRVLVYDPSMVAEEELGGARPSAVATDLTLSDYVRFKDGNGAAAKYRDNLVRIPRTDTLGYDINTFCVLSTQTTVTVRWQDCSVTTHLARSLVHDLNADDDDELWPGEIVVSRETKEESEYFYAPARVGVVQSVQSADRIASIRWFRSSNIRYFRDVGATEDLAEGPALLPDASLEDLQDTEEEVSLYDMKPAIGLNKRLGDLVLIKSEFREVNGLPAFSNEVDWLGEVIDLGLDGMFTVRQGLNEKVTDVRVRPEHLILVYGSDMDDSLDNENGDEVDGDNGFDAGYDDELSSEIWEDAVSDMDRGYEETIDYDGNGGQRMDEDGGEDAWSTESESDEDNSVDTPMTDPKTSPDQTPLRKPEEPSVMPGIKPEAKSRDLLPEAGKRSIQPFAVLEGDVPIDHQYRDSPTAAAGGGLRRIAREHKIFQKEGALPEGVLVRTWESRLDLLRVLFIGPLETPYMFAPFVMDIHLNEGFPNSPPDVYFHSWTDGGGPVNPNLYEDGKVCLSLLGTWSGEKTESWDAEKSTILQVLVSILGLVLVKEPYFNEAGFEVRVGSEDAKIPSALYSERTYLRCRAFIVHALRHPVAGLADEIKWLYCTEGEGAPMLLRRAIDAANEVISTSQRAGATKDGINILSAGALVKLRRLITDLEGCF